MRSGGELLTPEKQQQILLGAATVFGEDGYEGASMSRIAGCAGVSKGTLYNYYESKADLFAAWIAEECSCRLSTVFDSADPEGSPKAVLKGIGQRMLQMMMSKFGLIMYRVTVAEAAKFPELARIFYESGPRHATSAMTAWLELQVAAGHLDIEDPMFAADQFFALCQTRVGMLRRLGMLSELDNAVAERIVDAAVEMFLGHYGVRP